MVNNKFNKVVFPVRKVPNKIIALLITTAVIFVSSLCFSLYWHNRYNSNHKSTHKILTNCGLIRFYDEALTMSAKMAATTGDKKWPQRYWSYCPELDKAIEDTASLMPHDKFIEYMDTINDLTQKLYVLESKALAFVKQGQLDPARDILNSHEYNQFKTGYSDTLNGFVQEVDSHLHAETHNILLGFAGVVIAWVGLIFFVFTTFFTIMRQSNKNREKVEEKYNMVKEELIEASRNTGKAQIAQSSLHNIGNVLTNVNYLTSDIKTKIEDMQFDNFIKAVGLIEDHKNNLAAFFQEDEKGKKIPEFLVSLAEYSIQQQTSIIDTIAQLATHVSHMIDIIDINKTQGITESSIRETDMVNVVEDAIRLCSTGLSRSKIEIKLQYEEKINIFIDRRKLLQVLINLITNAKHSLADSQKSQKLIIVKIAKDENNNLVIDVQDNGLGMKPKDIDKIFDFGYTTKEQGQGIGLFSCKSIINEMEGSLTANSRGLGNGASFRITLPVTKSQEIKNGRS